MNQPPRDRPTLAYLVLVAGLGLLLLALICTALTHLFHIGGT
jgi:hypothetical protein